MGLGGYYSRVFINLKDREPKGIVRREEYEDVLRQLKDDFMKIRGPDGERWDNKAYMSRELYRELRNSAYSRSSYRQSGSTIKTFDYKWPE